MTLRFTKMKGQMIRFLTASYLALACLAVLSGCARDREDAMRAKLNQWFFLGDLEYFKSQMRCTAAVYRLKVNETRRSLPIQDSVIAAKTAFISNGLAAFQIKGHSPNDLTDALLLSGRGTFGKQALGSAAQAVPCFKGKRADKLLRAALIRPGAILAYDRTSEGLMILDPEARLVFYVAGDVW